MTPKEKAKQLVESMAKTYDKTEDYIYYSSQKECALIAVDEIIKSNPTYMSLKFKGSYLISDNIDYWQKVKTEIKKL